MIVKYEGLDGVNNRVFKWDGENMITIKHRHSFVEHACANAVTIQFSFKVKKNKIMPIVKYISTKEIK